MHILFLQYSETHSYVCVILLCVQKESIGGAHSAAEGTGLALCFIVSALCLTGNTDVRSKHTAQGLLARNHNHNSVVRNF